MTNVSLSLSRINRPSSDGPMPQGGTGSRRSGIFTDLNEAPSKSRARWYTLLLRFAKTTAPTYQRERRGSCAQTRPALYPLAIKQLTPGPGI